jgi:hypothetical protein
MIHKYPEEMTISEALEVLQQMVADGSVKIVGKNKQGFPIFELEDVAEHSYWR